MIECLVLAGNGVGGAVESAGSIEVAGTAAEVGIFDSYQAGSLERSLAAGTESEGTGKAAYR